MFQLILILLVVCMGFWFGKGKPEKEMLVIEKTFPLIEFKPFAVVLYAQNHENWCTRALTSVFEQDYEHYRVIVIDDGSIDATVHKIQEFAQQNKQDSKVTLLRNETKQGRGKSLKRAISACLDKEIVFVLDAKDWLAQTCVLSSLNKIFQNPDVWVTVSPALRYPTYEIAESRDVVCYAVQMKENDLSKIVASNKGHVRKLEQPFAFANGVR